MSSRDQVVSFIKTNKALLLGVGTIIGTALIRRWAQGPVVRSGERLDGKVVIVTGCSAGIGVDTARVMASKGPTVILANRSEARTKPLLDELSSLYPGKIHFIQLDLSDYDSIRKFVETFKERFSRLDILINNAGLIGPVERNFTKQGHELTIGTNHFGVFMLTSLLLDLIKKTPQSRVIILSSSSHMKYMTGGCVTLDMDDLSSNKDYDQWGAYARSKLANTLFAYQLQSYFEAKQIDAKAVSAHPGVIITDIGRESINWQVLTRLLKPLFWLLTKDSFHGAQTTLHCALCDYKKLKGGAFYADCAVAKHNPFVDVAENRQRLWDISIKETGVTLE